MTGRLENLRQAGYDASKAYRDTERLIGEGPFVGGAQPAVADIKVYMIEKALSGGTYDDISAAVLDPFDRLKALARGVASHPAVLAWYAPKT